MFDAVPEFLLVASLPDVGTVRVTYGYPYRTARARPFYQQVIEPGIRLVQEDRRVDQDVDMVARSREHVDENRRRNVGPLIVEGN